MDICLFLPSFVLVLDTRKLASLPVKDWPVDLLACSQQRLGHDVVLFALRMESTNQVFSSANESVVVPALDIGIIGIGLQPPASSLHLSRLLGAFHTLPFGCFSRK
jgi:hypothetical protein